MNKLVISSILTVFFLFSLLGILVAGFMYFVKGIDILKVVLFTALFNLVVFFLSPWIQDWVMRWLYGAEIYTADEFRRIAPEISEIIEEVSREYGFRPPRIVYIPDRNPTAFTYGSTRSRARIAITEGILEYLDPDERRAVVAHELGHIVHYDFAVMALATTLIMIIYELYVWSRETAVRRLDIGDDKNKVVAVALASLAFISYIFYLVGRFIVLYLSRVREYYADEFSARKTSPKSLASALLKVAYGIVAVPDDLRSRRLLRSTEVLGIVGERTAKEGALLVGYLKNPDRLGRILVWDLYSPWAFLSEISSTHPLTGKRILRLLDMAGERLHVPKPDMGRLYEGFAVDVFVYTAPVVFPILGFLAVHLVTANLAYGIPGLLVGLGVALGIRGFYSYPAGEVERKSLIEALEDPYTSPVRGKRISFRGKVVGRGTPGYVFGEDLAVTDGSGIIFVNYESWLPFLGNPIFALNRVKQLVGRAAYVEGWYFRSVSPWLDLDRLSNGEEVKSYPYIRYWIGSSISFFLAALAYFFLFL